jgi:CheY-like chemotaxis protein
LLTGTGRNTDRQWGLRAGASAVMARPVTEAALRATLGALGCRGAC